MESYSEAIVTNIFCSFGRGPPRFEGDRPRFGDRDGYRGGPRGAPGDFGGEKGGAPAEFQPSFRVRVIEITATSMIAEWLFTLGFFVYVVQLNDSYKLNFTLLISHTLIYWFISYSDINFGISTQCSCEMLVYW
jgi:hypothetical protein